MGGTKVGGLRGTGARFDELVGAVGAGREGLAMAVGDWGEGPKGSAGWGNFGWTANWDVCRIAGC